MMRKARMLGGVGRGMRPGAVLFCPRGSGVLGMGRGLPGVALCGRGEPQLLYLLTLTETDFLQEQRCPCSPPRGEEALSFCHTVPYDLGGGSVSCRLEGFRLLDTLPAKKGLTLKALNSYKGVFPCKRPARPAQSH